MNTTIERDCTFGAAKDRICQKIDVAAYAALDDFGVFQDSSDDQRIRICYTFLVAARAALRNSHANWKSNLLERLRGLEQDVQKGL